MTWRGKWPPSAAETPCPPAGAKGDRTPMVSCPLLTPLTFLWTRLPAVARLNARGPQGRLVLQEYTLDRSGAFRSGELPLCTGWPRTVMRGKPRKLTSGPYSVPKSARRTEPSPRFPRFAARPKGVAAQRRVWGSQEGAREPYGALAPFCLRRQTAALPAAEGGNARSAHRQPSLACGGKPPERRNRFPSVEGKTKMASAPGREHFFHSPEGFSAMR